MISAGLSYQYGELKSDQQFPAITQLDKSFSNLLGNVFARLKLSSKSNLRVIYRSSVSPPSITQLQNVINNSNQFFYTTGNPDLKQQYTNNIITRYTYTNSAKGQSFFANLFFQTTNRLCGKCHLHSIERLGAFKYYYAFPGFTDFKAG